MPYPPHDGGAIAMYDVLNGLTKAGHEVTLFVLNTKKHHQPSSVLQGTAKKIVAVDINTKINVFTAFFNLFKKVPYNFERFIKKEVSVKLTDLLNKESFDIIQVEGAQVAYYVEVIKKITKTPVVMRSHNVESLIWLRLAKSECNPIKKWYLNYLSKGIAWYEKKYINKFDKVIAITEKDGHILKGNGITCPISVVPAGVDFERIDVSQSNSSKRTLFVLGDLNWKPNEEGIKWFLNNVWDDVLKFCPETQLHIAGKNTPKWLEKKNYKNVKLHGYVESAQNFIKSYDVMLVPLLSGSGMRLKIIEGMALKKAVLTTSIGAEGIECADNKNIFIRDKKEDWLKFISAYYNGKINIQEVGENAFNFANEIHNNKKIINRFIEEYKTLVG